MCERVCVNKTSSHNLLSSMIPDEYRDGIEGTSPMTGIEPQRNQETSPSRETRRAVGEETRRIRLFHGGRGRSLLW